MNESPLFAPSINGDSLDYSFNDLINSISYSPLISENILYDSNNALPTIINNNTSNKNRVDSDSDCSIISNKAKKENEFINDKFNAIMATIINRNKNNLDSIGITSSGSEPVRPVSPITYHDYYIDTGMKIIHKVNQYTPVETRAGIAVKNHNKSENQSLKNNIWRGGVNGDSGQTYL